MAVHQLNGVCRYIRRLGKALSTTDQPDGRLVQRFVEEHDEGAFAELVHRHGRMVLAVCWRALRNEADAEDAFQATFLVLIRKAASIRKCQSVGPWLHGVARKVVGHAQRSAARRRHHERQGTVMPPADELSAVELCDLRTVLDEELVKLPEKYRAPLVLCYLEGETHEKAAQKLGWPVGTVEGRLSRARALLRNRLVRRGLTLPGGALAVALSQNAASAAVPVSLLDATVRTALLYTTGGAARAGVISSGAVALAHATVRSMFMANVGWWMTGLAIVLVGASMAGAVIPRIGDHQTRPQAERVERAAEKLEAAEKVKGRLLAPGEGTTISEQFEVRAEISGALAKGWKAVPAVESADGVLMWAKRPYLQLRLGGEWSATVDEGGTSKDLRVTVLIVPPDGLKVLADWFKTGEANRDFKGLKLEQITGAYRLDSVKVKKQ